MSTESDERSEQETARRRDKALRRALSMPPKPQKAKKKGDGSKAAAKPRRKAKREA